MRIIAVHIIVYYLIQFSYEVDLSNIYFHTMPPKVKDALTLWNLFCFVQKKRFHAWKYFKIVSNSMSKKHKSKHFSTLMYTLHYHNSFRSYSISAHNYSIIIIHVIATKFELFDKILNQFSFFFFTNIQET